MITTSPSRSSSISKPTPGRKQRGSWPFAEDGLDGSETDLVAVLDLHRYAFVQLVSVDPGPVRHPRQLPHVELLTLARDDGVAAAEGALRVGGEQAGQVDLWGEVALGIRPSDHELRLGRE